MKLWGATSNRFMYVNDKHTFHVDRIGKFNTLPIDKIKPKTQGVPQ
jgi:hypothetical protein